MENLNNLMERKEIINYHQLMDFTKGTCENFAIRDALIISDNFQELEGRTITPEIIMET